MINNQNHSSPLIYSTKSGRASVFASFKGSVTVEAAFAVPIFFFAVVCLLYLMEMMSVQTAIRCGLQEAAKKTAEEVVTMPVELGLPDRVEQNVVDSVGEERLNRSIIDRGSLGIDGSGSRYSPATGIAQLSVKYEVKIPVPLFGIPRVTCQETMKVKAWNGYKGDLFGGESDETVYVTETGLVYHKDYHCTHLDLSIRMVRAEDVEGLRNDGGGKYYPCEKCHGGSGNVYITDTGDRYHSSVSCSGLKRTIYAVPLSEVVGKGACSRCGR